MLSIRKQSNTYIHYNLYFQAWGLTLHIVLNHFDLIDYFDNNYHYDDEEDEGWNGNGNMQMELHLSVSAWPMRAAYFPFCIVMILLFLILFTLRTIYRYIDISRINNLSLSVSKGWCTGAGCRHLATEFPGDIKGGQVEYPWKGLSKCSSGMLISGS